MNGRVAWLLAVAGSLLLPFWLGPSGLTTAVFVVIAAIGATGLNVLTGYAGQVSLGHAFFLAVGAYSYLLLSQLSDQNLVWVAVAAAAAAVVGAAVGPLALRLHGLYLAVVTLGLVFIGQHVLYNTPSLSGGAEGRSFPSLVVGPVDLASDTVTLGPIAVDPNGAHYFVALAVLAAATLFARNLLGSRSGRAMLAVRQRPDVAALSGVDVARTKVVAFAVSAGLGGLSGALYVAYVGYTQPAHWDLLLSVQFVAAIIIGGLGTLAGPVIGSAVVFALPTALRALLDAFGDADTVPAGALSALIYGLFVVAFLVLEPDGLVGLGRRIARRTTGSATSARTPARTPVEPAATAAPTEVEETTR